jgi:pantoate--beta-alanine ligase
MQWATTIAEVRATVAAWRKEGLSVGLVPTMGYFHEGHLTLMRTAKKENDRVVVSLFVNPTQFGPSEDFDRYPRDHERDKTLAEGAGADLIFAPTPAEMYPEGYQSWVEVTELSQGMCGASRPGHFRGVTTVVSKLFMIVLPDQAYFGEKDAQQLRVLRRMAKDLNMPLEVKSVPIVREGDGLAMSSRNIFLSPEERQAALVLSRTLFDLRERVADGQLDVAELDQAARRMIAAEPLVQLEYLVLLDDETLKPVKNVGRPVLAALAARVGKTRLIDNVTLIP